MTVFGVALKATRYHWRTHLPAMAFVALATAIVTGALAVQTSIRSDLYASLVTPLGRVNQAFVSNGTFRAELAGSKEVAALSLNATASSSDSRTSFPATIWGLGPESANLWSDYQPLFGGQARVAESLRKQLNLTVGSRLFLRVPVPNAAPLTSVFGRRMASESTVEVSVDVASFLPSQGMGDFSLTPKLGGRPLVIIDREWLSQQLKIGGQANVILSESTDLAKTLSAKLNLADHGIRLSSRPGEMTVRSNHVLLTPKQVTACEVAAQKRGAKTQNTLVALAEEVRIGGRHISYAMVAGRPSKEPGNRRISLNEWAALQLGASVGDKVDVTLLVPKSDGTYRHPTIHGSLAGIVAMKGDGANPNLVPTLSGMTDSQHMSGWSTPFPIDLTRITPSDEDYWKRYQAAPKVFVDSEITQLAWGAGDSVSSVSVTGCTETEFAEALLQVLKPEDSGLSVIRARDNALLAAMGSSDLAGLILGLSSFLILSALAIAGSLLVLNFQSRARDLKLMSYVGLSPKTIFGLLAYEALFAAMTGAIVGTPGGALLAKACLVLLARWQAIPSTLGNVAILLTVKDVVIGLTTSVVCALGAVLIYARPLFSRRGIRRPRPPKPFGSPLGTVSGLLIKSIRQRPLRMLSVAMIVATSTAVLGIAAGSYSNADTSGTGGIRLQVETTLPVAIDWTTVQGRKQLHFDLADEGAFEGIVVYSLLRSPGTDVSCLNPAKPTAPRISAIGADFIHASLFASTDNQGKSAWPQLLGTPTPGSAISAIGDGDTLEWILGTGVGQTLDTQLSNGTNAKLSFAGATHGSFLAGDLLVSKGSFHQLFPDIEAPSLFLVKTPESKQQALSLALARNLSDYGVTIRSTTDILSSLRGVFNAYISIFIVFGVMGLILGVCGASLSAARNALERQAEFALMLAVGLPRSRVRYLMIAETQLGVLLGTSVGLILSVFVALAERASISWLGLLVAAVAIVLTSTISCIAVSALILRRGILGALRSE